MKNKIKFLTAVSMMIVLLFAVFAFCTLELNALKWGEGTRMFFSFCVLAILFVSVGSQIK